MKKTDINKYNTMTGQLASEGEGKRSAAAAAKIVARSLGKFLLTFFIVFMIAGAAVGGTTLAYILQEGNKVEAPSLDLQKLDYNSVIYVENEEGEFEEYLSLHSSENRVWVNFSLIPQAMKDAIVAIEDKRFKEHEGVDWWTTFSAVRKLFTGQSGGGGSTITQQLVKNITGKNEVSLLRKVREIFMALKLEDEYSKDEILEAYLNIVHFGSGCNGVQSAAQLYFGKDIQNCDLAECAAIAGITQNPYKYNPLMYPENNKERQQTVLTAMYDQEKISKAEYEEAMEKSEHMKFVGYSQEAESEDQGDSSVWNWYIEAMYDEVTADLMELYDCDETKAQEMLYHNGLKIYCAMDSETQKIAEEEYADESNYSTDGAVESGFLMMDYNGRVLATVGSRQEKTGNLWFSYATDAKRQPGSTIKPIGVYSAAMDMGMINYSSLLKDEYVDNYFPNGDPGPHNAWKEPQGEMVLPYAIAISQNTTAAQLTKQIGTSTVFDFLTNKLHFENLTQEDSMSIGAMSIGGLNGGMTVKEMAAAYQIFGNGGQYNEPYTYYYVEDHDGNRILDNTQNVPEQVLSTEDATVMNHLLHEPIYNSAGTGRRAAISGWDVFGKTGTTDSNCDAWFVGGTQYAVAAVWSGYPTLSELPSTSDPLTLWRAIMSRCVEDKNASDWSYTLDSSVVSAKYCLESGLLAGEECKETATGWYQPSRLPATCKIEHKDAKASPSPSVTPSASPTATPTASPTPTPTAAPTPSPSPSPTPTPSPAPESSTDSSSASSEPDEEDLWNPWGD
ncbi:MAG TPA: transglycosylase domain-containing protein [Candidatus Gallacutalibacter pullistercoris]|nr:transglycosylase domain-containing protein [Candidatus Gallacutalibacter pullistercoris]